MNRGKLSIGLVLICIGIYVFFMGIVASDTTDLSVRALYLGAFGGVVLVAGGLTLTYVGASEK